MRTFNRCLLAFTLALSFSTATSSCEPRGATPPASPAGLGSPPSAKPRWVGTWGASTVPSDPDDPPVVLNGQTVREIVRVSLGGPRARVRISNAFGTTPLRLEKAEIARHSSGPSVVAGGGQPLLFGGTQSVSIPPHGVVTSDPVALSVPPLTELAVSLFVPDRVVATTEHSDARTTTYFSPPGDFTSAATFAPASESQSWHFLAAIDVEATEDAKAVVALGDSLTDGYKSTIGANHRWTDRLAERLQSATAGPPRGVVNEGISGNRLLHDFLGPSALSRFDADVVGQAAVRYVIVLEGANDLGIPGLFHRPEEAVSAAEIIGAHQQLIRRAHAHGLLAFGGTLPPFEGMGRGYDTPSGEEARQTVNRWMRAGGEYDAVIDFDAVLRDPARPSRLLPAFDSGDHIHPNDTGYQAMADAVDLTLFRERR